MGKHAKIKWALIAAGVVLGRAVFTLCMLLVLFDEPMQMPYRAAYLSTAGYAAALGARGMQYEDFAAAQGEPARTERRPAGETDESAWIVACYPQAELYSRTRENVAAENGLRLSYVRVLDASLRFGDAQIGLGSTRAEIEAAYALDEPIPLRYLGEAPFPSDAGYYGDGYSRILFCFDAQDRVNQMVWEASVF